MDISSLATLCIERNAWKDVLVLARANRQKELHAFTKKRIKELGQNMLQLALDEIEVLGEDDESDADEYEES